MATREFSKNPSKALREADAQPVLVTKYGHPIACVLSIESWNDLLACIGSKSKALKAA